MNRSHVSNSGEVDVRRVFLGCLAVWLVCLIVVVTYVRVLRVSAPSVQENGVTQANATNQAAQGQPRNASKVETPSPSKQQTVDEPNAGDNAKAALKLYHGWEVKKATLDELLKAMRSEDRFTRLSAIRANEWPDLWPKSDAPALIKALGEALQDKEISVRVNAAQVLRLVGPDCIAVLPDLLESMKEDDAFVKGWSIQAIGMIGPEASSAVPALVQVLTDEKEGSDLSPQQKDLVGMHAAFALANIGPDAVPSLVALLKRQGAAVLACQALRKIGPQARAAIPALKELASDKQLGWHARCALEEIEETRGRNASPYQYQLKNN
jgi:HEAT repeat protein